MAVHPNGFSITANGPGTFAVTGELDLDTRSMFEEAIADAVLCGSPVVLDLCGVTFMDSSGVHAVIDALEALPSGCLVIHGAHGQTERLLALTRLDHVHGLHIVPCEDNVLTRMGM